VGTHPVHAFYEDPPIEIELIGGYFDGQRMYVPEHRDIWLMPIPADISLLSFDRDADVSTAMIATEEYRWTGVRDDGTRVFQYRGRATW
jgi:hypothetical protein